MLRKMLLASGIALAVTSAAHADYQVEVRGGYLTGDIESGSADADFDSFMLQGTFYFTPVDTSKGPLAEASFIDRASDITVNFQDGEIDGPGGADADIESYGISTRVVLDQGWLLKLGYQDSEIEDLVDGDVWNVGVGKYIAENTTLTLNYLQGEADDMDVDAYGLNLEHLFLLANDQALRLDVGYTQADPDDADEIDLWNLGATFYFNRNISVNANYSLADSNEVELENWSIGAEWFINNQVAVSLSYLEAEEDENNLEADGFVISGRFRF